MSIALMALMAFRVSGPYKIVYSDRVDKSTELRYHSCYEDGDRMAADAYYPAKAGTRFKIQATSHSDSIRLDTLGMAAYINFIANDYQDSVQIYMDGRGSPDMYLLTAYFSFSGNPGGYLLEMAFDTTLYLKPTYDDSIIVWLVSNNQVSGTDSLLVGMDTSTADPYTSGINFVYEDNGPWLDLYTTYHVGNDWGFTIWYTLFSSVDERPIHCYTSIDHIYPNPARHSASVDFSVPQDTRVKVCLFDATGRLVQVAMDKDVSIGWHTASFDLDGLSPGAYLVKVSSPFGTQTRTLIVR